MNRLPNCERAIMNRISLIDLAKNEPLEQLLEKEVLSARLRTTRKRRRPCSSGSARGGGRSFGGFPIPPRWCCRPAAIPIWRRARGYSPPSKGLLTFLYSQKALFQWRIE